VAGALCASTDSGLASDVSAEAELVAFAQSTPTKDVPKQQAELHRGLAWFNAARWSGDRNRERWPLHVTWLRSARPLLEHSAFAHCVHRAQNPGSDFIDDTPPRCEPRAAWDLWQLFDDRGADCEEFFWTAQRQFEAAFGSCSK
jgi:hypothetical protein